MNLSNNRVDATLSGETINELRELLRQIREKLPFLVSLTSREKQLLIGIQVANKQFVEDAVDLMKSRKSILPPHVSPEDTEKDYALYIALDTLMFEMDGLYKDVKDTQFLAGAEAYHSAIGFYRFINIARKSGVPGAESAYNQLRTRFMGRGNEASSEPEATEEV